MDEKIKNLVSTIVFDDDIDFGIIRYKKLLKMYKSQKDLDSSLRILEKYGIAFVVEDQAEKYVVIPEDITSMVVEIIDNYYPPSDITFENFLLELNKDTLRRICKVYSLKLSGNKREIVTRILNYRLTPEDVLSIMDFNDVIDIAEELNVFPWDENIKKKYDRDTIIKKTASHIILSSKSKFTSRCIKNYYDLIYDALSSKFQPILKWDSKESDIEKQLCTYLKGLFDGLNIDVEIHSQYSLPSGKIDVYIPQGDLGIEIKYNPSRTSLRETVQRIKEYKEDIGQIIVIIFYNSYHNSTKASIEKYRSLLKRMKNVGVILREV